jgi:hypothetical protein
LQTAELPPALPVKPALSQDFQKPLLGWHERYITLEKRMHKVAQQIETLLTRANLSASDFLDVTDNLVNNGFDIEAKIIGLMAPLSAVEKEQVLDELSKADRLASAGR